MEKIIDFAVTCAWFLSYSGINKSLRFHFNKKRNFEVYI